MTADNMDEIDNHIVTVAGHGIDPSPVPQDEDAEDASAHESSRKNSTKDSHNGKHAKDSNRSEKSSWREILAWYVTPIVLIVLIRLFVLGAYTIPSGSMLETIHIGDNVITSKLTPKIFSLHRGDIVVFEDPANWLSQDSQNKAGILGSTRGNLIKRLIGLPGDTVECKGKGEPIVVNGVEVLESSYIRPGVDPSDFPFKVKVKPGHVFVLGDNRSNSADSRYHRNDGDDGLVPISKIEGVAVARFWPLNRIGLLDSHHDAFEKVPNYSK